MWLLLNWMHALFIAMPGLAMRKMSADCCNATLLILGPGVIRSQHLPFCLQHQVSNLILPQWVTHHSGMSNIERHICVP